MAWLALSGWNKWTLKWPPYLCTSRQQSTGRISFALVPWDSFHCNHWNSDSNHCTISSPNHVMAIAAVKSSCFSVNFLLWSANNDVFLVFLVFLEKINKCFFVMFFVGWEMRVRSATQEYVVKCYTQWRDGFSVAFVYISLYLCVFFLCSDGIVFWCTCVFLYCCIPDSDVFFVRVLFLCVDWFF